MTARLVSLLDLIDTPEPLWDTVPLPPPAAPQTERRPYLMATSRLHLVTRPRRLLLAAVLALPLLSSTAEAHGGHRGVKAIIRDVWPDAHEDAAIRVVRCESEFNPSARNSGGYRGLFQMGRREWRAYGQGGNVYNPHDNAAGALRLFKDRGWQPWVCARLVGLR